MVFATLSKARWAVWCGSWTPQPVSDLWDANPGAQGDTVPVECSSEGAGRLSLPWAPGDGNHWSASSPFGIITRVYRAEGRPQNLFQGGLRQRGATSFSSSWDYPEGKINSLRVKFCHQIPVYKCHGSITCEHRKRIWSSRWGPSSSTSFIVHSSWADESLHYLWPLWAQPKLSVGWENATSCQDAFGTYADVKGHIPSKLFLGAAHAGWAPLVTRWDMVIILTALGTEHCLSSSLLPVSVPLACWAFQ